MCCDDRDQPYQGTSTKPATRRFPLRKAVQGINYLVRFHDRLKVHGHRLKADLANSRSPDHDESYYKGLAEARTNEWNQLVLDAFNAHRVARKIVGLLKRHDPGEMPAASTSRTTSHAGLSMQPIPALNAYIYMLRAGISVDDINGALAQEGKVRHKHLVRTAVAHADSLRRIIRTRMLAAQTTEARLAAVSAIVGRAGPEVGINDEESADSIDCLAVPWWLCILIVAIVLIVTWLKTDPFNATDDDQARDQIASTPCDQFSSQSLDSQVAQIRVMLDGPTGDDDENAILKILDCTGCDRVSAIVASIGLEDLLDNFQGTEWDKLMIRLQQCGLVSFGQWDDNATRRFINRSDCATINALSNSDLNQLVKNLLSGFTGDDDENALIRLFGCIPCSRRKEVMSMAGSRYSAIDSAVQGSEWTTLKPILNC